MTTRRTHVALVDADIVAYTAACVGQDVHDFGDGDPYVHTDFDKAKAYVRRQLDLYYDRLSCDRMAFCWSGDRAKNFRRTVLPSYKENRKDVVKPELLSTVTMWMQDMGHQNHIVECLEADDMMGILQTGPYGERHDTTIVSIDKDMGQIPGRWFNPDKDEIHDIGEEQGEYVFLYQTLTGDRVDGYKGCPGIGGKRAEKLLDACWPDLDEAWDVVVDTYESKGLTYDDALVQARCARILRRSDWDAHKGEPILWEPTR